MLVQSELNGGKHQLEATSSAADTPVEVTKTKKEDEKKRKPTTSTTKSPQIDLQISALVIISSTKIFITTLSSSLTPYHRCSCCVPPLLTH